MLVTPPGTDEFAPQCHMSLAVLRALGAVARDGERREALRRVMSRDRIAELINFVPQRWETVPRTLIWRPVPLGSQMPGPHLRPVHASRSAGSSRQIERRRGKGECSPAGEGGRMEWRMECREPGPEINKEGRLCVLSKRFLMMGAQGAEEVVHSARGAQVTEWMGGRT